MFQQTPDFKLTLKVYHGRDLPTRDLVRKIGGFSLREVSHPDQLLEEDSGILLLDSALRERSGGVSAWRTAGKWPFLIIGEDGIEHADFLVPKGWPANFTLKALEGARREISLLVHRKLLNEELDSEHQKLYQLTTIGLALSAERDLDRLLAKILSEGRRWACCDAASLFLIEKKDNKQPNLLFKLTQNDSVNFSFEEKCFPLNKMSIAGYVAVTGETLNLSDVYDLSARLPYRFNPSFDKGSGYRTRSMLTIPMKNHNQEMIGVLQFINRKSSSDIQLKNREITEKNTLSFKGRVVHLLEALASQAAVAIGNTLLVDQIQDLFEGFVTASVRAIEARDPSTWGPFLPGGRYDRRPCTCPFPLRPCPFRQSAVREFRDQGNSLRLSSPRFREGWCQGTRTRQTKETTQSRAQHSLVSLHALQRTTPAGLHGAPPRFPASQREE